MEYRKRKGHDTWHWEPECSNYPVLSFDSAPSKPTNGELCNECIAKSKPAPELEQKAPPKSKAEPKSKPKAKAKAKAKAKRARKA